MKKLMLTVAALTVLAGCNITEKSAEVQAPEGMRQGAAPAVTMAATENPAFPKKGEAFNRNWQGQPPLIPHDYKKDIDLKRNGCLSCHKPPKQGKQARITPTDASHYLPNGELNGMYYNCNQCHVAQADNVKPQVGNLF